MSKYLADLGITIYYTDTDCIVVDKPLPDWLVGDDIGLFKLEWKFIEAVFLAPKVYSGKYIDKDNTIKTVTRIKGYKNVCQVCKFSENQVTFDQMFSLLNKDSTLQLTHDKWTRHLNEGYIKIHDQIYNLTVTSNKRKIIRDYSGRFVSTKPYIINMDKEILNK
jgi:hypothetical protein